MVKPNLLFEVSYEVCNKVGGIYALLRSKAPYVLREYGDDYVMVGPYVQNNAAVEFEEQMTPEELSDVVDDLLKLGIKCHYGRWQMDGKPKAILVDHSGYMHEADDIKAGLWEYAQVDSLNADNWFTDPLVWSTTVGMLLERIVKKRKCKCRCIAHFHEWLTGGALLKLKQDKSEISTVFTTHATVLGRALAEAGEPLYSIIGRGEDGQKNIDLAKWYNVLPKHTMEVACAKHADVFTTVSEVTAKEAAYFLDRTPDHLLLNGIDLYRYPPLDELVVQRRSKRRQMRDFLTSYFSRYYHMDFYNIRSMFISGRYEFRNKGIDLFIDSLGMLNRRMKKEKTGKNVVAFLWIPSNVKGEDFQVLKNKSLYEEMKDHIEELWPDIEDRMTHVLTDGDMPKSVLDDEDKQKLRKLAQHFVEKRGETPPLCAFELAYPKEQDTIMQALWKNELLNREEDKVKVIYYPSYLSTTDRLISLDYGDATLTCDVGVFPSYYEPWGYTPLETAAQGSLAITTDCAGFGKFVEGKGKGIYVLKRCNRTWENMVKDLSEKLFEIVTLSREEMVERRANARELAALADWKELVKGYFKAYETLAGQKVR
ncbi:MAG: glycogen/starch synthase [Candidatus Altiarchaeota archaeon]